VRYAARCFMLLLALIPGACTSNDSASQPSMPITAVPEGTYARNVAGQSAITWLEPTGSGKSWQEDAGARTKVETAITDDRARLGAIDYPALSLPDFVTYTRALTITDTIFTGTPLDVEAFGTGNAGERWTLYVWQGPELPQHPDRPLVHRWITVYSLYDMNAHNVTMLLPTIRGEVHE